MIANALAAIGCEIVPSAPARSADLRVALPPPIQIDRLAGLAMVNGRAVRLTRIELGLLGCLIEAAIPIDRQALIARIWGYRFDPETNLVAVHISRLRAKLWPAFTIAYRSGYFIEAGSSPAEPVRSRRNQKPARQCS